MDIVWRDSMAIGEPIIDLDHKRFIDFLNKVERGLQQNDLKSASDVFEQMLGFVENHPEVEEHYFNRISVANMAEHHKEHEALAYRYYVLLGRHRAADSDAERRPQVVKLAELMREWLTEHILKEIRELKPAPQPAATKAPAGPGWQIPGNNLPNPTTAPAAPPPRRQITSVPDHLQKFIKPLDYQAPRPPQPMEEFDSFQTLCEAAIWRCMHKTLIFFQRHNDDVVRDLPMLFISSPEFSKNLRRVMDETIFPALWENRPMKMLATNFDRHMSNDEEFFERLGDRNAKHIMDAWTQIWGVYRMSDSKDASGNSILKATEASARLRKVLAPENPEDFDLPRLSNREIDLTRGLLDPGNDWWYQLNKLWRAVHDFYVQEMTPQGDPDTREGTLRDYLIEAFNSLPEPWGDLMILTTHRVFPRIDCGYLERLVTNFGRTESAREAVLPYTMRYIRQMRDRPEIREKEKQEEEEYLNLAVALRRGRNWSQ